MSVAHIHRGDTVVVIAGREKGKRGKVLRLLTKKSRVVVERIAMVKRHVKPSQKHPQGGVIEKEGSLHISNVQLWCDKCSAARRSRTVEDGGRKLRACVKCETKFQAT
jgi:large subunit ribosomal protein L24